MEFFDKVKAPTLGVLDVDDDTGIKRQVAVKNIIPIIVQSKITVHNMKNLFHI